MIVFLLLLLSFDDLPGAHAEVTEGYMCQIMSTHFIPTGYIYQSVISWLGIFLPQECNSKVPTHLRRVSLGDLS